MSKINDISDLVSDNRRKIFEQGNIDVIKDRKSDEYRISNQSLRLLTSVTITDTNTGDVLYQDTDTRVTLDGREIVTDILLGNNTDSLDTILIANDTISDRRKTTNLSNKKSVSTSISFSSADSRISLSASNISVDEEDNILAVETTNGVLSQIIDISPVVV